MSKTTRATSTLMLVLFIDGLGQGIIFPILTTTIIHPSKVIFLHSQLNHFLSPSLCYGLLIGIYYLMWFISAPILGDLSDKVGRKNVLLSCLLLAATSFLLAAYAFKIGNLTLLLFSRFLGGVTSGDQAIAKAAIIDSCPRDKKSIYLGLLLFAVTLGLVTGPLMGSILQETRLVSWFNHSTPFYFAFTIAIVNVILIKFYYHENTAKTAVKNIAWLKCIRLFAQAFNDNAINRLLLSYFFTQLGWQMFYIYTPDFATLTLGLSTNQASTMLALLGVGIGIGLGVLPVIYQHHAGRQLAIIAYCGLLICNTCFIISSNHFLLWLLLIPMASLFGLAVANILPLISNAVSESHQGWIMGITGSIVALTGGLSALITGLLTHINQHFPYCFATIAIAMGIILLYGVNK